MLISKYGNGSVEKIEEFERKYGIIFDEEYRIFLIKYNGGDTPKTAFRKAKRKETLTCLFGINTKNSIEEKMKYCDSDVYFPIGEDIWGNFYAIGITEQNRGVIYFCDHEKGFKEEIIANSTKEFFSMCKSEKIGHIRTIDERKKAVIEAGNWDKVTEKTIEGWQKEIDKYKNIKQEEVII